MIQKHEIEVLKGINTIILIVSSKISKYLCFNI
jgi:hypothetical protein